MIWSGFLKTYIDFMRKLKIKPGFETRNSAFLINKLTEWGIDLKQIVIVAPYNKIGFSNGPFSRSVRKGAFKRS